MPCANSAGPLVFSSRLLIKLSACLQIKQTGPDSATTNEAGVGRCVGGETGVLLSVAVVGAFVTRRTLA